MPATVTSLETTTLRTTFVAGGQVAVVVRATWTGSPIEDEVVDIEIRDGSNVTLATVANVPFDENGVAVATFGSAATTWDHAHASHGAVTDDSPDITVSAATSTDYVATVSEGEEHQVLGDPAHFTVTVKDDQDAAVNVYLVNVEVYLYDPDKLAFAVAQSASPGLDVAVDEAGQYHFALDLRAPYGPSYAILEVLVQHQDLNGTDGRTQLTFLPKDVAQTWTSVDRTTYKTTVPWVGNGTKMLVPVTPHITEFASPATSFYDSFTVDNPVGGGSVSVEKVIRPGGVYARVTRTGTITKFDLTVKAFGGLVKSP